MLVDIIYYYLLIYNLGYGLSTCIKLDNSWQVSTLSQFGDSCSPLAMWELQQQAVRNIFTHTHKYFSQNRLDLGRNTFVQAAAAAI